MRLNDDGKTVAAMDVLVPKVGELIGGSQREERLEVSAYSHDLPMLASITCTHRRVWPHVLFRGLYKADVVWAGANGGRSPVILASGLQALTRAPDA